VLLNYHIGRLVLSSQASACNTGTTQIEPYQISNTQQTENKTTDVVIQQHSRKLLKMEILMSETCWVHNKWNKIASDIKLVFHSSTYFIFNTFFFFFEIRTVYKIKWKNYVDLYGPQMTIGRMRIACWIPKARNTHTDCAILINFHNNNGCTKAPQCYVIHTLPVCFSSSCCLHVPH